MTKPVVRAERQAEKGIDGNEEENAGFKEVEVGDFDDVDGDVIEEFIFFHAVLKTRDVVTITLFFHTHRATKAVCAQLIGTIEEVSPLHLFCGWVLRVVGWSEILSCSWFKSKLS